MVELMAEAEMDPRGEERADWRNAILCSLVANALRGKDDPPVPPSRFVPDLDGSRRRRDEEKGFDVEEFRERLRSGEGGKLGGTLA